MCFEEKWVSVTTSLKPVPDSVLQLIKCGCAKEKCATNRCQCRKAGLSCTDLCQCMDREDDEDQCHNRGQKEDLSDESDKEDKEDNVDDDDDCEDWKSCYSFELNLESSMRKV